MPRIQHFESGFDQVPPHLRFTHQSGNRPHLDAQLEQERAEVVFLRKQLAKLWKDRDQLVPYGFTLKGAVEYTNKFPPTLAE